MGLAERGYVLTLVYGGMVSMQAQKVFYTFQQGEDVIDMRVCTMSSLSCAAPPPTLTFLHPEREGWVGCPLLPLAVTAVLVPEYAKL